MIPGGYGDADHILAMLRAHESIVASADVTSRVAALNVAISLILDEKTGRTFGDAAAESSELHWVGPYDTIVLNRPATAITKITYGGTVSGTTMTGGTDILAADLVDVIRDPKGRIYAIRSASAGVWSWYSSPSIYQTYTRTPVLVTATYDTFGYDADTTNNVPEDIQYIVDYMIVERLKVEKAGSSGAIGPTGDILPIRDVFDDPVVEAVITKYRVKVWAV